MNSTDDVAVKACYRTLRDIALRTEDPDRSRALKTVCSLLLTVLGEESKVDSTVMPLLKTIFSTKAGFIFIPLL